MIFSSEILIYDENQEKRKKNRKRIEIIFSAVNKMIFSLHDTITPHITHTQSDIILIVAVEAFECKLLALFLFRLIDRLTSDSPFL